MTSQQYANAMLAAWHYRRDFIARQMRLPISPSRIMAMADDNFTLTVKELSREYETTLTGNKEPAPSPGEVVWFE